MLKRECTMCLKVEEYQKLKRSEEFFRQVCEIFGLKYDSIMEYLDEQSESSTLSVTMGVDPKEMMVNIFHDIQNQRDNEKLLRRYLSDISIYISRIKDDSQLAEDISRECHDKLKLFCEVTQ